MASNGGDPGPLAAGAAASSTAEDETTVPPSHGEMNGAAGGGVGPTVEEDTTAPPAAANDGGDDNASAAATTTSACASNPTRRKTLSSADWGGSRVLSREEEAALLLSEFLREFWPVFASPTAAVPPPTTAAEDENDAAGKRRANAEGADCFNDAAAGSKAGGAETAARGAGTPANGTNAAEDTVMAGTDEGGDEDDIPIAEARRQQKMATADSDKAAPGVVPDNDALSAPRKPPTITPRVVQDAARLLAQREERMYRVSGSIFPSTSSDSGAKDTGADAAADNESGAPATAVPDLVDEDHAAAVCDMEQTLIRLGVLGTKALAEDVLVVRPQKKSYTASGKRKGRRAPGADVPDLDHVTHFSALLNLPGSDHFRQLLGPVDLGDAAAADGKAKNSKSEEDQWHHRALPLPPNMLTYRSYLRLALMVSCLSSDDDVPGSVPQPILQACKSPLCAFLPSLSIGSDLRPTRGTEHPHTKGRDSEDGGGSGSAKSVGWKWAKSTEAQMLSGASNLTGSDIVALWIRAQRNTGAWRQLVGIFRFVKTNAGATTSPPAAISTGGTGSGDSDNDEDISAPTTYRAIYVGNHMNAQSREDESKRVDSLVTWAVTNQVLFSWGPIRDDMAMGLFPELVRSRNKRRGGKVTGRPRAKSAKQSADDAPGHSFGDDTDEESCDTPQWMMLYNKPLSSRITSSPSSQLPDAALVALQSFTIRLLSAMHRPILTVLYTSKPDSFLVPDEDKSPSQQFLSRLVGQNLPGKIKEEMLRSRSTSDRTLARIDRRLAAGKYIQGVGDDPRDRHYQFYDLVRFVLRSLRHSLDSDDQVSRAAVTEAIEDWARIRGRYLNSDNSKNWWSRGGWLSMSPGAIQSALLAPWAESEKCHICTEDVPSTAESDDVWVCGCCATSITHAKCHLNESVKSRPLSSMLRSYEPLQQVYSLRSPAGLLPIPDYTKKHLRNTIKWSRHTITLDRPIVPGERLPTWGLGINHLERAEFALDEILGQKFDATRLSSTDRVGVSKELGSPMPFRLPCPPELAGEGNKNGWKAILVGTVMPKQIAERAGVRVGDIIVAMDLNPTSDVAASTEASKGKDHFDLSHLTKASRVDLFRRQDVSSLRLHIYRAENVDLAKQGQEFLDKSIQLSLAVMGLHKSNKDKLALAKERWYCSACRSFPSTSSTTTGGDEGGTSQSIHQKAFCCRSVVRRLAVEWYARPFVDEDHGQGDFAPPKLSKGRSHDCYVSLRRLDGMFSHIMEKHADKPAGTIAKDVQSELEEVSPFFYAPPSSSFRAGRKRLEWAPVELEIDPFRLLCKGMGLILSSTSALEESGSDNSLLLEQRAKLARHFLPLFSSYCLDSSTGWEASQGNSNKNAVVRGPPNTIIAHCPPFLRKPCNCCGVRPTKDGTAMVGFCSENCRVASEKGWLVDTVTGDNTSESARCAEERIVSSPLSKAAEERCHAYDTNSSLVGSTILVMPDDPLFDKVCTKIGIAHEDYGRPLEMIIASYLPFDFVGIEGLSEHGIYGDPGFATEQQGAAPSGPSQISRGGNANNGPSDKEYFIARPDVVDGGIFQLIPVLHSNQLAYVEGKCGLREPPQKSKDITKSSTRAAKEQWTDVEALQLHGIVHLSFSEMRYRLKKTTSLCSAIDSAVAHLASTYGGQSIEERAKENCKLLDAKDVNPLGSVALSLGGESVEQKSLRQLLEQFSSQGGSASTANAIFSLGHPQSNLLSSRQACRLEESSVLVDAMIYSGVDIIVRDTRSSDGDDGFDTDIDEDDASRLSSISQKHLATSTHHEGVRQMTAFGEPCALASPKASAGGEHLLLLEPTRFEASSDYTICYSDLVLFKGDVRKMGGLAKSVSLARRLELEKEKMGQLESTEPAHLTISPPKFCRVSEKKLMEFPKRKLVEFGVCPELNRIGGRFDVILHRLTPHDKAGADGENSDDEEWNPDKDGANEDANASAGASGRALNEFKGRGWGFELVRWRMDLGRVLRVGRVHPASPASRAGLLPNDIILSINGKAAATLTTEGALARELIATSYAKIDRPSGNHHIVDLLSKHKVLGGPIALQVLRVVPGIRRSSSQSRSLTPSHSHESLTPPGARGSQERQQRMQQQEAAALADQQRAIQQRQEQIRREREQQQQQQQQRQRSRVPPERPALAISDLYKQGAPNSILTRAETSVLVEAAGRRLPKLGVRLLVPRYPRHIVLNEYRVTIPLVVNAIRNRVQPWPKISDPIWRKLAEADYKRSQNESGDVVDEEPNPSNPPNSYQYTEPIEVLPIDRLLEGFLKAQHREQEQQGGALLRQQRQQAARQALNSQQQQIVARQEGLRRRQEEEERERARQEARRAEQALVDIEDQRRQLDQQAAESRRVLARAQASVGGGHQPPVAGPLQPQPSAYAMPQQRRQGGFVDLTDNGQGDANSFDGTNNADELQRIRGGGEGGDGGGNKNGDAPINDENGANESVKNSVIPADGYPLPRIARSDWKGFVVIGKCHTQAILENGQSSADRTYFLGILNVDAASSPQPPHGQETLPVVVFYLAKKNIFLPVDGTIETKIEPCELFAAREGSIAEQIYDEWVQRSGQDVGVKFYPAPASSNEDIGHGQNEPVSVSMLHCFPNDGDDNDGDDNDNDVQIVETSPTSQDTISLRTAANLLVRRLSCRTASLLGYLPDDRAVVWLKSDPEAIYLLSSGSSDNRSILTDDVNQLQYVGRAISNREGSSPSTETGSRFSCVWGCGSNGVSTTECSSANNESGAREQTVKNKHLLSYDTQEELTSHLNRCHGYVDTASCSLNPCARVSNGEAIIRLCADLSLASCARCPGLVDCTVPLSLSDDAEPGAAPTPQHVIFDFQRNLNLSRSGKGGLNLASIGTSTKECPGVRDMLRLVSRLCRLFAIEKRGEYRLSLPEDAADEELPMSVRDNCDTGRSMSFDTGEAALLSSIERDIEACQPLNAAQSQHPTKKSLPLSRCGVKCMCTSIDHSNEYTTTSDRATCSICSIEGEGVIDVRGSSDENSVPSTVPSGIGCALLSDFPDHKPPSRRKISRDAKIMARIKAVHNEGKSGQLKALKVMLLTIALRVPPSLYGNNTTTSIWEDDNFHRWCVFVEHVGNERMLAQAYLLLINSVNKNRMPNWWTAKKSGWSSPMTSLHFQTLSSLSLNFYVFDAAVLDGSPSVSDGAFLRGSNSGMSKGPSGSEGDSPDKHPSKKTKKGGAGPRAGDTNQYFEKLKNMNIVTRMKTALKWADECGLQRLPINEAHNDVCTVCKDGGDLLCCELCNQSQHAECLGIQGGVQGINFDDVDFICEQCQLDMTLLKEVD